MNARLVSMYSTGQIQLRQTSIPKPRRSINRGWFIPEAYGEDEEKGSEGDGGKQQHGDPDGGEAGAEGVLAEVKGGGSPAFSQAVGGGESLLESVVISVEGDSPVVLGAGCRPLGLSGEGEDG